MSSEVKNLLSPLSQERSLDPILRERALIERQVTLQLARMRQALSELAQEALDTITELMRTSRSPRIRLEASKDILDRAGVVAPKVVEVRSLDLTPALQKALQDKRIYETAQETKVEVEGGGGENEG